HPCAEHLPVLSTAAEIGAGRLRRALPSGTTLRGVVMFLRRQPRPYGTHLSGGCVLWPHDWGLSLILCQSLDFYRSLPESEFLAEAGRFRCLVSVRACSLPQPRRYSGRSTLNCGRRASPETVPASARGVVRPHEAAALRRRGLLPGTGTLSRTRTPRRGAPRQKLCRLQQEAGFGRTKQPDCLALGYFLVLAHFLALGRLAAARSEDAPCPVQGGLGWLSRLWGGPPEQCHQPVPRVFPVA